MKYPRCDMCAYGVYFEDWSVGISGYYECDAPDVSPDEFERIDGAVFEEGMDYETAVSKYCTHYKPITVDKCSWCGKTMGIPLHDVKYHAVYYWGEDEPACSQECEDASIQAVKEQVDERKLNELRGLDD